MKLFYRSWVIVIFFLGILGACAPSSRPKPTASAQEKNDESLLPLGQNFDPTQTGTITGVVRWTGPIPDVPAIDGLITTKEGIGFGKIANPAAPIIDPQTKGIRSAIVYLETRDPTRSKPWTLDPVTVEIRDQKIEIKQGSQPTDVGIVRLGDSITMVSRDEMLHILRARNAAFFSLPFPQPNQPLERPMTKLGLVELTSGMGFTGCLGHIMVTDQPYCTVTDNRGQFTFNQVPSGLVTLQVIHPNWQISGRDKDPETGRILRINYCAIAQKSQTVNVQNLQTTSIDIELSADDFPGQ